MKRSPASWTTAIAASALLAMPVGTWAQQTSPQQTSPTPSQTTASKPAGAQSSANEDLRKAEAALNDIPAASLTGAAKGRVAELKRHITALQRTSSSSAAAGKTSPSTELAAADRILTELLGGAGTTGAAEPSAAGTSGKSASKAAPGVDDAAKAKLQEVRTHLTAFAASMGGGTPSPSTGAEDPSASASAAAAAAAASPSSTAASATPSTSTPQASPASPGSQPPTASSPSPAATPTPTEPAAPAAQQPEQQPPSAASVDTDAVKRHLTAARESLSQLTQLPAAGQLTGDARTQVSQLISNFNELITTNTEWRASYAKVQANLNALVGEQRADESPAPAPGVAGAVGTSGTATIDPAIKAKLVEFRTHLMDFEKAAGGGATASASPAASPATPAEAAAAAQPSTPATTPSTPAAQPAEPTPSPTPTTPPEPTPTGTSGRTATPTPTGTTGSTTPSAAPTTPTPSADHQAMQSKAMNHIEAIEAVLNGSASSLDRAQVEQIRKELAALRKAINQSEKDK